MTMKPNIVLIQLQCFTSKICLNHVLSKYSVRSILSLSHHLTMKTPIISFYCCYYTNIQYISCLLICFGAAVGCDHMVVRFTTTVYL